MGKVLAGHPRRHEIHHVIKVPVPDFDDGGRFDAAKFRLRVEEALAELHTDRIAVIQHLQRAGPNRDDLRIPAIEAVDKPLRETFETLREEGKVGYLTSFPYTPAFAEAALATGTFSGLVAYYNVIEMEMARFFPILQRGGGGFSLHPPVAGGAADGRARQPQRAAGRRPDARAGVGWRLRAPGAPAAAVGAGGADALRDSRFALAHPVVASLIVGLNTVAQVDQVIDAAAEPLDRNSFDQALAIFRQQGRVVE